MKNSLFFLLCLIFLTPSIIATGQFRTSYVPKLVTKYEVTGGIGLLNSATYHSNNEKQLGYSFGVGVTHAFTKSFELKARALYELKGSCTTTGGTLWEDGVITDITRVLKTDLYYVTLALLPTFHLTKRRNIVVGAGGFYSFHRDVRISEKRTDKITNIVTTSSYTSSDDQLENDFGASVYGGYIFSLSEHTDLTLMLHYNKSLTDYNDVFSTWERNNVFLFSVTFGLLR